MAVGFFMAGSCGKAAAVVVLFIHSLAVSRASSMVSNRYAFNTICLNDTFRCLVWFYGVGKAPIYRIKKNLYRALLGGKRAAVQVKDKSGF